MKGLIIAAPLATTAPLSAGAFLFGSVLPDIDMAVRCFGKVGFLRCHQTYTHSLPVILLASLVLMPVLAWLGINDPWPALALAAGMITHSLMDMSNTYGVALFTPFGRRRFSLDLVFFIDATTMAASVLALAATALLFWRYRLIPAWPAIAYVAFLSAYWLMRWVVRRRAWKFCPDGTRSLVPSSFKPWRFHGYGASGERARLFDLNAVTGAIANEAEKAVFDRQYEQWLQQVAEYQLMRELSLGYHAFEASRQDGTTMIVCKDLRTRNFGGRYGTLEISFDSRGNLRRKVFRV